MNQTCNPPCTERHFLIRADRLFKCLKAARQFKDISVLGVQHNNYLPGEKHITGAITCCRIKLQADYFAVSTQTLNTYFSVRAWQVFELFLPLGFE